MHSHFLIFLASLASPKSTCNINLLKIHFENSNNLGGRNTHTKLLNNPLNLAANHAPKPFELEPKSFLQEPETLAFDLTTIVANWARFWLDVGSKFIGKVGREVGRRFPAGGRPVLGG